MTEIVRLYNRGTGGLEAQADIGPNGQLLRGDESAASIAIRFLEERTIDELLSYLNGPHLLATAIDTDEVEYDTELKEKHNRFLNEPATERGYRLSKDWIRYRGPFGGEGWQHVESGDVRYVDDPPGDVAQENQTQTTLPGTGYELPVDLDTPKWAESTGTIGQIIADEFAGPDGNPRLMITDEWFDNDEYEQNVAGFLEATGDWLKENGDGEMASRLQERLQELDGQSPWGENNAPDYLNPENTDKLTPLYETEANAGVSARSMMIGEKQNGDRVFYTNVNESTPGGLDDEYESDALNANESAKFLTALGVSVPNHHYEEGEFLAVAEADGRPLDGPGQSSVTTGEYVSFAATQILAGNGDAHGQNIFSGFDGLTVIDLDLATKRMDSKETEWALGKLFDSAVYAGIYEPYEDDEVDRFVDDIQQELEMWVQGDMVDEALDEIDDSNVRERIEFNIQQARNGDLIAEDQKVRSTL